MRPDFKLPDEPNQLFYIERSVNSNTVVYTASLDPQGAIHPKAPVDAYWRWFNVDGHIKPLNFVERMMAYGVHVDATETGKLLTFSIVPLPERKITLAMGADTRPEARMKIGDHIVRLAYVRLFERDRRNDPQSAVARYLRHRHRHRQGDPGTSGAELGTSVAPAPNRWRCR